MQYTVGQPDTIETRHETNQRVDADQSPRHLAPDNNIGISPKMTRTGKKETKFESTSDGNVVIVEPSFDEEDATKKNKFRRNTIKINNKETSSQKRFVCPFF
mmetsp:Transcript_6597/g.7204  ORF Transcript_6597/g.7204 Transcript_6597/m.7204 type:complete len:102 (+) Transcript_6597:422-727(+)